MPTLTLQVYCHHRKVRWSAWSPLLEARLRAAFPVNRAFLFLSSVLIFKFGSFIFCSVLILVGIQVEVMVWAQNTLWLVTKVLVCLHIKMVVPLCARFQTPCRGCVRPNWLQLVFFSFVWPTLWSLLLFSPLPGPHSGVCNQLLVILVFWCHRLSFTELSDPVEGQLWAGDPCCQVTGGQTYICCRVIIWAKFGVFHSYYLGQVHFLKHCLQKQYKNRGLSAFLKKTESVHKNLQGYYLGQVGHFYVATNLAQIVTLTWPR